MGRLLALCLIVAVTGCERGPTQPERIRVGDALGGEDTAGYARALAPRTFRFPADHGPHPGYKHEWWYVTGNLDTPDGRAFGYQLTFFRIAMAPSAPERPSPWGTHEVWMGHLALTDVAGGRHLARERIVRGALGLAGARPRGERVWVEDWTLARDPASGHWRIAAHAEEFTLALELVPTREPVLQGDGGLSQKGAAPGNASYYYSLTRLRTSGRVTVGGVSHRVSGLSWFDREWSTSALEANQTGWDWISLQLGDGTDIMYYRLRRTDGSADPHSRGMWLGPDGNRRDLLPGGVELEPREWWTAPGGGRYPVTWMLRLQDQGRALRIEAVIPHQLMDLSVRYWEGAVRVYEAGSQTPVGRGYLEMTGYDD